jgi:hypothetical protein
MAHRRRRHTRDFSSDSKRRSNATQVTTVSAEDAIRNEVQADGIPRRRFAGSQLGDEVARLADPHSLLQEVHGDEQVLLTVGGVGDGALGFAVTGVVVSTRLEVDAVGTPRQWFELERARQVLGVVVDGGCADDSQGEPRHTEDAARRSPSTCVGRQRGCDTNPGSPGRVRWFRSPVRGRRTAAWIPTSTLSIPAPSAAAAAPVAGGRGHDDVTGRKAPPW